MKNMQNADPEKLNQKLYRILLFMAIPACGFISAGFAYIFYFDVDLIWPYLMIPVSILVLVLLFIEANLESGRFISLPNISRHLLNQITLGVIVLFGLVFLWWIYYLIFYVQLQK